MRGVDKRDWFMTNFKRRVWLDVKTAYLEGEYEPIDGYIVNVSGDCVSILPYGMSQEAHNCVNLDFAAIMRFEYPRLEPWQEINLNPDFKPFDPQKPMEQG